MALFVSLPNWTMQYSIQIISESKMSLQYWILQWNNCSFLGFKRLPRYNNICKNSNHTLEQHCINVKSKDAWFKLNEENRKTFESADDQILESMLQLAEKFKDMDTSRSPYSGSVMCLTQDTSNALHLTLKDIETVKTLTTFYQDVFKMIDWKENSSLSFYYTSVEQIMNSLVLQILKLFSKLDIEEVVSHSKEQPCRATLTEGEIFMLDEAFSLRSPLSDRDERSFLYISWYVAFKDRLALKDANGDSNHF